MDVLPPQPTAVPSGRPTRLSPDAATWCLTVLVALLALLLHAGVLLGAPQHGTGPHLPWPLLLAAFAVAELTVVHVKVRGETLSHSLAEVPLVLGLALASPSETVSGYVLGSGLVLLLHRRQPPLKLAFNLAHLWLDVVVAVLVWQVALGPADPASARGALAALLAALALAVASAVTTGAVMAVRSRSWTAARPDGLAVSLLGAAGSGGFALVALDVTSHDWRRAWSVGVLAGFLALAHRQHLALLRRHDSLSAVQGFTRETGRSDLRLEEVVAEVLRGVRGLLQAAVATLHLDGADGGTWCCDDDGVRRLEGAVPEGPGSLSAPLQGEAGVVGRLTVTDRPDDLAGLGPDDLVLLETLAGHAALALHNGRLTDQLRQQALDSAHQALHDALTGLPNRVLFDATADVLTAREETAVLLFDLDRFKEINDTLGHAAGDRVLQAVAGRLVEALPDAACVARLGGDEFAVVLAGSADEAAQAAEDVHAALSRPLELDGLVLSVDASVGIALAPVHGQDTATLLRSADIAMYVAKGAQCGTAVYEPDRDHHSAARLAMVGDLRTALAEDQLLLVYQPKTGTSGRTVPGVEALVRWRHPVRGLVPPDDFIGLAERTGLIGPLTEWVLRTALTRCRSWLDEGLELGVAVNVSPRNLLEEGFAERVVAEVQRCGVPASLVTLEITEGAVMVDPERGIEVLRQLRGAGLRLSVDDLGVGHSSLGYLKRLPVHELKIDRSFVTHLVDDPDDAAIVGALVQLGHRMGLSVVAEGVEDEPTLHALARLGADTAQGYWMSRPLPAGDVAGWVRGWTSAGPLLPLPRRAAEGSAVSR